MVALTSSRALAVGRYGAGGHSVELALIWEFQITLIDNFCIAGLVYFHFLRPKLLQSYQYKQK